MRNLLQYMRFSLVIKLIFSVGIILLLTISTWAFFSIRYQKERLRREIVDETERLSNTIKLGTHYAMMLNSRDDINQIIMNIGKQKGIENIRIYNKQGEVKYSNAAAEVDVTVNIKSEPCEICHRSEPPLTAISLAESTRIFENERNYRRLGMISPIYNEPECASSDCHFHPADKKILGALDVVVSLAHTDQEILFMEKGIIWLAGGAFLVTAAIIFLFVLHFVNRPIRRLIRGTRAISKGDYSGQIEVEQYDEIGQLATVINQVSREIGEKQKELNRQKDEYQSLFETVPCIITVQNKDYRLVGYNREFSDRFDPRPGDYCFHAYKSRETKCPNCPVERTFKDGRAHYSEETGVNKDGSPTYWIVKTSPIRNKDGEIVAAMEMNLDITHRKQLEQELERSEKKYHDIFNNIRNPIFVLDAETLEILDCNHSVQVVYGYTRSEIVRRSFLEFFNSDERMHYIDELKSASVVNQVKQIRKDGKPIFVDIWISPSQYPGRNVLLVTASDITERLETEQQLIQASKMATLGEMATGVAHELNQPLAVIKTASSYFMKKVKKKERIKDDILFTMAEEIDSHVDRATKIINHMRQFGRKADQKLEETQLNDVLRKSFEIFSQQLKVRGIDVIWQLEQNLPMVMADADRLEQVFINLLINARDAIEEKWESQPPTKGEKRITLRTRSKGDRVLVEVADTGIGIPKSILEKIFEPFFTTKKIGKGTGLGLSISYRIVQDLGGNIRVSSRRGEGAFFEITFPASSIQHPATDI
ncbi:MAG: PAS domain S-box protein [Desulfobacterales bacterium]|nr:MAG: PAS domain S-box protein [Desulfobacterales bacterium]